MKKVYSFLLIFLAMCILAIDNVNATAFTKEQVEESLARIKDIWVSPAPSGTTFSFESTATETIITSSIGNMDFVSHFVYNNGIYSFISMQDSVLTSDELVKVAYENFNISFLVSGIYSLFDEETVKSVEDVVVGDTSHIDRFTLENDGVTATILPIEFSGAASEDGVKPGFIKSISMDINHPNFIKWLVDNDGELVIEVSIKKPEECDPATVVSFTAIINNGQPIKKGTPLKQIPVKIIETHCDGSTTIKESNVEDAENEIGYKIENVDPDKPGEREATVTKVTPNPDGSTPEPSKPKYTIVEDDSKDVVDFEVIINDGNPVIKGTADGDVPIRIVEKLRDGSTVVKESNIRDVERDTGYKVDNFSTGIEGDFTAKVTKLYPNTDGSTPGPKDANYKIVPRDDGNAKDVIDFEAVINDGKPIIKGTSEDKIPIKIIVKYRDGTNEELISTIGKVESEFGYKVDDFSSYNEGTFVARVTRIKPNSDGSTPGVRQSNYRIIPNEPISNPQTGIMTYGAIFTLVVGGAVGGYVLIKKQGLFKRL